MQPGPADFDGQTYMTGVYGTTGAMGFTASGTLTLDAETRAVVVRNCGESAALRVSVTDRVRRGASLTRRGGGALVRGRLRWETGTLASGERRTYRITKRSRAGTHVNLARADGDNTGPSTGQGSTTVRAPSRRRAN